MLRRRQISDRRRSPPQRFFLWFFDPFSPVALTAFCGHQLTLQRSQHFDDNKAFCFCIWFKVFSWCMPLHCPPTTFKCQVLFLVPQTSFPCQVELQISVHRGFQTPQCPEVSPWCLSTALHEWHLKKYALGKVVVCFGIICMCCTLFKCIQVRNGAKLHLFCIAFASFFCLA